MFIIGREKMADKLDLDVRKWLSKKSPEQDVLIKDIGINSYQVRYSNVERLKNLKKCLKLQVQIFILY